MSFVVENIRLAELAAVANSNRTVFFDFIVFLRENNYPSVGEFVRDADADRTYATILEYLRRPFPAGVELLDGVARPYHPDKAKFFFLAWLLRDAPAQRLGPMVASMPGGTLAERRAAILNQVRAHVATFLDGDEFWEWEPIFEVMVDRLEGSRRAIKGTLFEAIVRRTLQEVFEEADLKLAVGDSEIRLEGETFDVSVMGRHRTILMPVKTRETMGGGHALLFTRDIHKSITAAHHAGYECIPVVIAESWGGDLEALECRHCIKIDMNPNQITAIEPVLKQRIIEALDAFAEIAN